MKTNHYQRIMTNDRATQNANAASTYVASARIMPAVVLAGNAAVQAGTNAGVQQRMLGLVTNRVMPVVPTTSQQAGGGTYSGGGVANE
jgi:hypothetical protein